MTASRPTFRRSALPALVLALGFGGCARSSTLDHDGCEKPLEPAASSWRTTSDTGVIDGVVLMQRREWPRNAAPVPEARIIVMGTARVAVTDTAGHFRLPVMRPGPLVLRVIRIGFAARRDTVVVGEGGLSGTIPLRTDLPAITCCSGPICL